MFIICAEGLSALFKQTELRGEIHGRRSLSVSHFLFADNSFFFFRANDRECLKVKHIFDSYERASDQAINLQKLGIFFSSNTPSNRKQVIMDTLSIHTPLNHNKYLGLRSLIGKNKWQIFSFLKDRL